MIYKKPVQKLVLFTDNELDLNKVKSDMDEGWSIVNLIKHDNHFVGIMEQLDNKVDNEGENIVFIPPRKKLKIST